MLNHIIIFKRKILKKIFYIKFFYKLYKFFIKTEDKNILFMKKKIKVCLLYNDLLIKFMGKSNRLLKNLYY